MTKLSGVIGLLSASGGMGVAGGAGVGGGVRAVASAVTCSVPKPTCIVLIAVTPAAPENSLATSVAPFLRTTLVAERSTIKKPDRDLTSQRILPFNRMDS
jgi:hypothetical protein